VLADYRPPADSRIRVTTNRRGTEIVFPAFRNPGVAAGSAGFTLLWTAGFVATVRFDAPVVFPIVFGLLGIVLIVGTLQLCFGVSRVVAQKGLLTVAKGYFTVGREKTIPVQEISDLTLRISMQAGSRPYYDVMVARKDGKKVAAGRWIRNKREAQWLAATLKNALELPGRRSEVTAGYDG
jgi:hypothetical protein